MITFPSPAELTYDNLVDTGVFQQNHLLDPNTVSFDGLLYETYGDEVNFVRDLAQKHPMRVATLLECDGAMYLASGYHYVNRIGYFVATEDLPQFDGLALDPDGDLENLGDDAELSESAEDESQHAIQIKFINSPGFTYEQLLAISNAQPGRQFVVYQNANNQIDWTAADYVARDWTVLKVLRAGKEVPLQEANIEVLDAQPKPDMPPVVQGAAKPGPTRKR